MNHAELHALVAGCDRLDAIAWELNRAAQWAADEGKETEADMLEQHARGVLAVCWLLSRPIRPDPPPQPWRQQNGQQQRRVS